MNLWIINYSDDWGDLFNFRLEWFLDEFGFFLLVIYLIRRR